MDRSSVLSSVALTTAGAVAGSIPSSRGTSSAWYRALRKPRIQPPAAVFPVVWTGLYGATAAASIAAQANADDGERRAYRAALAANMTLNAGWCWTFFAWHRRGAAVVVAAALAVSTADLARRAGAVRRGAGVALLPYAGWTAFATVLTEAIRRANRDVPA
jgi:tryptophan-rich sensory protein